MQNQVVTVLAACALSFASGCRKEVPPAAVQEATATTTPESPALAASPNTVTDAQAKPAEVALPPAPALPQMPAHLPEPQTPEDNPTTPEKVALGHMLFFDPRMSKDGAMACESCHHIAQGYTSGQAVDAKVGGGMNTRNAPTMLNVGYHTSFYWDGRMPTLEAVSNAAWKGQLGAEPAAIAERLNSVPEYRAHFQRAFNEDATAENIPQALAAFLRTLRSGNAPFDRYQAGDENAVSEQARRGHEVFQKAGCVVCHLPPLYTNLSFHNVGIGSEKPQAERDNGRMNHTKEAQDSGRFKTPTLRDVAKTAPYFHDGSVATLEEAIEIMASGGKKNPNLDPLLKPQKLSKADKAALKAFLESLSGEYTFTAPPQLPPERAAAHAP